jgi:hypothetical protein
MPVAGYFHPSQLHDDSAFQIRIEGELLHRVSPASGLLPNQRKFKLRSQSTQRIQKSDLPYHDGEYTLFSVIQGAHTGKEIVREHYSIAESTE